MLDEECTRLDGSIGSFCLIVNHIHLVIKMGGFPLDEIIHVIHTKYAKYFNQKRDTLGDVFQGWPGTKIVLQNDYLNTLIGYIHRNPLVADLAESVFDSNWSSWRWIVGDDDPRIPLQC